jgi:uncharacterized protein (DUF1800 family)
MNLTRRDFVRWTGGASLLAVTGCTDVQNALKDWGFVPPSPATLGPVRAPLGPDSARITHAISRFSFGARPGDFVRVARMGLDAYLEEQLHPSALDDRYCDWKIRRCESIDDAPGDLFEYKEAFLWKDLARATLLRAVYSERQLYEVMVGFWTDHFNIDISKGDCKWLKTSDDREVVRKHALGKFPELVRAVALSPAMLWYLDGRENRKASMDDVPNENYARELMELHTLGVHGGYTQQDVMEAARCLTGWTVKTKGWFGKGKVAFKPELHDHGEKTVLGHTIPAGEGENDLDRLLDIVLNHPATARFIATKLCRKFIMETPPDDAVTSVAATFTKTGGDITSTLRTLFGTQAFADSAGAKFKRPFRYLVSTMRTTGTDTTAGDDVLDYLIRMGQAPFEYPTPDGYPEESAPWMGTMLWRWHFAVALAEGRLKTAKADLDGLKHRFEGDDNFMAHLLTREPTARERQAYHATPQGPALMLASPAFQRY